MEQIVEFDEVNRSLVHQVDKNKWLYKLGNVVKCIIVTGVWKRWAIVTAPTQLKQQTISFLLRI